MAFSRFASVAFVENVLFKSYGGICSPLQPSSLPDELSTDKRACNGFLSTERVHTVGDSFYNTINSSLIMADLQISFLAFCMCLLLWHTWYMVLLCMA